MWNRSPVQVWCMRQGAQGQCTGMTQRDGMGWEVGVGSGWGTHVHPWLIHVNVWQKPLQYCKVISFQLKLKKKKKKKEFVFQWTGYGFNPWSEAKILQAIVNYKLALTKSIANDWATEAFASCVYGERTPCRTVDLQQPLRGLREKWGTLCSRGSGGTGCF